jgi:hypothetical protein
MIVSKIQRRAYSTDSSYPALPKVDTNYYFLGGFIDASLYCHQAIQYPGR